MKRRVYAVILFVFASAAGQVHAQGVGDQQKGLRLAQDVCSQCHAIRRALSQSPNPRSPTFYQLATTPGMTTAALMVALTTPHAGMPMFMLTAEEREDIITYILSLR